MKKKPRKEVNLKYVRNGLSVKFPVEHSIWRGVIDRCHRKYATSYKWYGKRGISVCKRWHLFSNFISDMGKRPSDKHSLDRINNNGDYKPSNCRWVTWDVQANNNRKNRNYAIGDLSLSVTQWAIRMGIKKETLFNRLNAGWPLHEALTVHPYNFNRGFRPKRRKK